MKNDDETSAGDFVAAMKEYTDFTSAYVSATADTGTKIIEAVREYLAINELPAASGSAAEGSVPAHIPAPDSRDPLAAYQELTQNPSEMSQRLSLYMLAAVVRRLSSESGRTEAEILEHLAANFRDFKDHGNSAIELVKRNFGVG